MYRLFYLQLLCIKSIFTRRYTIKPVKKELLAFIELYYAGARMLVRVLLIFSIPISSNAWFQRKYYEKTTCKWHRLRIRPIGYVSPIDLWWAGKECSDCIHSCWWKCTNNEKFSCKTPFYLAYLWFSFLCQYFYSPY